MGHRMQLQLDPIHENESALTAKSISINKHYRIQHSVQYERVADEFEADDIWHRPALENEAKLKANEDGKALIVGEYADESMKAFIDLLIENETECDALSQLLCKQRWNDKSFDGLQMFDPLRLSDDSDDGGLDPN